MASTPRQALAALLDGVSTGGSFTARRSAPVDDLAIEVRGVGRLALPVTPAQARQLCKVARPAAVGLGEQTLVDRRVRDTWEVPRSRVKIDKRRWNRTLAPILAKLARDLGLPAGRGLKAELHSMLVYARGQFFAPHQDSEKADGMLGTLVVSLPSEIKGGALVVAHGTEEVTYRGPRANLSFVAFYADCRHEVRPVRSGHRVVLTYNLVLGGDAPGPAELPVPAEVVEVLEAVADSLAAHFGANTRTGSARRLVYLLDHEYTPRALSWSRLKGSDALRARVLHQAAQRGDCNVLLALADVHEVWSCYEPDRSWGRGRYSRRRRWSDDEAEEWQDGPSMNDPDDYELEELVDWSVSLDHWLDCSDRPGGPLAPATLEGELCASTPSVEMRPYSSEYEGYMGNYGNTMDRWYYRGAVVVWPDDRDFEVRAEGSSAWALDELWGRLRSGDLAEARDAAASVAPFWNVVAVGDHRSGVLTKAIRVARALDEPDLAAMLLGPFRIEVLGRVHARALAALVDAYGEEWVARSLASWSDRAGRQWPTPATPSRTEWVAGMAGLCDALCAVGPSGAQAAKLLVADSWRWLAESIDRRRRLMPPSQRERELSEMASPVLGVIDGAARAGASVVRDDLLGLLCDPADGEELLCCSVGVVRQARAMSAQQREAAGVEQLSHYCASCLEARLDRPGRDDGDWSIVLTGGCSCELCERLAAFLADPAQQVLEWPLAEQRRGHVHGVLDREELPVLHQTRRKGSPYALVLTKTEALFEQEERDRARDEATLAWLRASAGRKG